MPEVNNLAKSIQRQLPEELSRWLHAAGEAAQQRGLRLYLVGGVVRDLLLGRTNLDLDLVVEGDAIALAKELAGGSEMKLVTHPRFGTARLRWGGWSVDLAMARSETYARPGALPAVQPGSVSDDLARRDFTINAIAVELNPGRYGEVLDPHRGRDDLANRFIRVLHQKSFVDDATRIWRGIRYEQRLDFRLEPATLSLLRRDIDWLDTISGDRIRHELELVLREEMPEKALRRADELGVLGNVHPSLRGDEWLAGKFEQARLLKSPDSPAMGLYLVLLAYRLSDAESERLILYLKLPKLLARPLQEAQSIKERLAMLAAPDLAPSGIYALLHGYHEPALTANLLAASSLLVKERIRLYLSQLRAIKPVLSGNDLKEIGVPEGPEIKQLLNRLRNARLDGEVRSKKDEEAMAKKWVGEING